MRAIEMMKCKSEGKKVALRRRKSVRNQAKWKGIRVWKREKEHF